MYILGFRPGSVIVDYKMEVGETKENAQIGKEELVQIIKVSIDENRDTSIFDPESVVIEGEQGVLLMRCMVISDANRLGEEDKEN